MRGTVRTGPECEAGVCPERRVTWTEPSPIPAASDALVAPALPLRPLQRPPVPLLVALDDDAETGGEVWRVRATPHVIGRTIGETTIPHDPAISARHAAIWRRVRQGRPVWHLEDLGSTNGVFVRVTRCALRPGLVVMLGARRYVCEAHGPLVAEPNRHDRAGDGRDDCGSIRRTVSLDAARRIDEQPPGLRLRELLGGDQGRTWDLPAPGGTLGRSPKCDVAIPDDPYLDPVAAQIVVDGTGRTELVADGTRNGIWTRIRSVELGTYNRFLIGEQRFLWTLPSGTDPASPRVPQSDRTP